MTTFAELNNQIANTVYMLKKLKPEALLEGIKLHHKSPNIQKITPTIDSFKVVPKCFEHLKQLINLEKKYHELIDEAILAFKSDDKGEQQPLTEDQEAAVNRLKEVAARRREYLSAIEFILLNLIIESTNVQVLNGPFFSCQKVASDLKKNAEHLMYRARALTMQSNESHAQIKQEYRKTQAAFSTAETSMLNNQAVWLSVRTLHVSYQEILAWYDEITQNRVDELEKAEKIQAFSPEAFEKRYQPLKQLIALLRNTETAVMSIPQKIDQLEEVLQSTNQKVKELKSKVNELTLVKVALLNNNQQSEAITPYHAKINKSSKPETQNFKSKKRRWAK